MPGKLGDACCCCHSVCYRQGVQVLTLPPALAGCCAQQGNGTWPGEMCRTLWDSSGPPVGICTRSHQIEQGLAKESQVTQGRYRKFKPTSMLGMFWPSSTALLRFVMADHRICSPREMMEGQRCLFSTGPAGSLRSRNSKRAAAGNTTYSSRSVKPAPPWAAAVPRLHITAVVLRFRHREVPRFAPGAVLGPGQPAGSPQQGVLVTRAQTCHRLVWGSVNFPWIARCRGARFASRTRQLRTAAMLVSKTSSEMAGRWRHADGVV